MTGCSICWASAPRRAASWGCTLASAYASLRESCDHVPAPKPVVVLWELLRERRNRAELAAHMVEVDEEPARADVSFRCACGRQWEYVWDMPAPCGCERRA